jgi:AcrR family transcriptional regulator
MSSSADPSGRQDRTRDADRTKAELLQAATREFADQGFSGARVDAIAENTSTTKRMIYYYFGDKEGLYLAVLENAYLHIRALEQQVDVDHLDATAALRRLAEITFDHHETHEDFIRLVSIENVHHAEHLKKSDVRAGLAAPALDVLTRILKRGKAAGAFRKDIDALDVHMIISSYCVFRTANRYTFGAIFDRDLLDPRRRAHMRRILGDMVVALATSGRH